MTEPFATFTLIETLRARADFERGSVARWRSEIATLEAEIAKLQARIAEAELAGVEDLAAANLLQNVGFRVDRTEDGVPRVMIDRTDPHEPEEAS